MAYNVLPLDVGLLVVGTAATAIIGGAIGALFAWLGNSIK